MALSRIHARQLTRAAPYLGWAAIMLACLIFYVWGGTQPTTVAFVQNDTHPVAALYPAKVATIHVQLGQRVAQGDTLATLVSSDTSAQIRIKQAELQRIKAAIEAERVKLAAGRWASNRTVELDDKAITTAQQEAAAQYAIKSAELAEVKRIYADMKIQLAKQLVMQRDLAQLDVQIASITEQLNQIKKQQAALMVQASTGRTRRARLPDETAVEMIAPLFAEQKVIEQQLAQLYQQQAQLTLRAPRPGHVSAILHHSGDVVLTGQPVVVVDAVSSQTLLACAPESAAMALQIGDRADLYARDRSDKRQLLGKVVSLASSISELPVRCRTHPQEPIWGRQVVIALDRREALLGQASFDVVFSKSDHETPAAAIDVPAANAAPKHATPANFPNLSTQKPIPIKGVEHLRAISRFEPSGLVWVSLLNRYLVVSDDTGLDTQNDHAPWIFSMDAHGQVTSKPMTIFGVDEVNDLESITQLPGPVLYALSSQSHSKRGRRPKTRQYFLQLSVTAGQIYAQQPLLVAQALDQFGNHALSALGLVDTTTLNIEGMTAWDGDLLLGLKSPLDSQGRAIIWRLRDPAGVFRRGQLRPEDLSIWAKVSLKVQVNNVAQPAGIAELLQLPDRSLLIAATVPEKVSQQDGALWHVTSVSGPAPGELHATQVQSFLGRKPEGMALSGDRKQLLVVFDNDTGSAELMMTPWQAVTRSKGPP